MPPTPPASEPSSAEPPVTHTVLLFASLRERAGADSVEVAVPAEGTVADLRLALTAAHPVLAEALLTSRVAVDQEFRDDPFPIAAGAEVAIIPPVSGG